MASKKKGNIIGKLLKGLAFTVLFLILIMVVIFIVIQNTIMPKKVATRPARVEEAIAVTASAKSTDPEAKVIHVNGFDLWYKVSGNPQGKPIIVIHGGPGLSSHYFDNHLDFLKKEYRVINYDQRGSGLSEFKSDCRLYTFDSLVEELNTIIKDEVKEKQVIILGHSFGSAIALAYAVHHREKVEKLILVSSNSIRPHMTPTIRFFSELYKDSLPPFKDPEVTDSWYCNQLSAIFAHSFYNTEARKSLDLGSASYATAISVFKSLGDINYVLRSSADLKPCLTGFDKPTLITYGVKETLTFSEEDQIMLHNALRNSTLVQFEKSGHWAFMEEPEKFQQIIWDFLKK